MKKHFLYILIFFVFTSFSGDWTLVKQIPFTEITSFTTDNLGNAYVVSENILLQFDNNGKPVNHYDEKNLGRLARVDADNPLKILAFYPDFAQVNILNSQLALQSTIQLRGLGIEQPVLICNSKIDYGIWVYDHQDFKLKKIDLNLQVTRESGNIPQLTGKEINPRFLIEGGKYVLMADPDVGILFFDQYGTYFKTHPVKNVYYMQATEDELYYVSNGSFYTYNFKTLAEQKAALPVNDSLTAARVEQNRLFLTENNELKIFSY
jgi:hypothetical protein